MHGWDITCINKTPKEQHIDILKKDQNGFVLERKKINYFNGNGTLNTILELKNDDVEKSQFTYDEKGSLRYVTFYKNDEQYEYKYYLYDKKDIVEIITFEKNSEKPTTRATFAYKNNKTIFEVNVFFFIDEEETLMIYDIYYLDDDGRLITIDELEQNWKDIFMKHILIYNDNNLLTDEIFYNYGNYYGKVEITYNNDNNPIELIFRDKNNSITSKHCIRYVE
ncbi:MAG: hypothetical protein JW881_00460 [Spirochaetales bacterium]|nr:hypothetical protein [Spirochaetales bacterium]